MAEKHGIIRASLILGSGWALWHFIPWSWNHSLAWMMGMWASHILMRTIMLALYLYGGKSLFVAIEFHAMINVSMDLFPGSNLSLAPWSMSLVLLILCSMILRYHDIAGAGHPLIFVHGLGCASFERLRDIRCSGRTRLGLPARLPRRCRKWRRRDKGEM